MHWLPGDVIWRRPEARMPLREIVARGTFRSSYRPRTLRSPRRMTVSAFVVPHRPVMLALWAVPYLAGKVVLAHLTMEPTIPWVNGHSFCLRVDCPLD